MSARKPTLFIECSATYYRGINTGIQRVVRNIVRRAPEHAAAHDIDCKPVVARFGHLWTSEDFGGLQPSSQATSSLYGIAMRLSVWLVAREKEGIAAARRFRPVIAYAYLFSAARRLLRYAGNAYLQSKFLWRWATGRVERIAPQPGDILLMPDAFWAFKVTRPLARARYRAATIIPLIHDLIPVSHPQYFAPDLARAFSESLEPVCRVASGFVTVSGATAGALAQYLASQGIVETDQPPPPIAVWHLGADVVNDRAHADAATDVRPEIRDTFRPDNTFLMVGTIEPRKGYDLVFDAFSRLWAEGFEAHLVIVGRVGWECDGLLERMKSSPRFGDRLHVYHDADDHELHHLYRNSKALIFASRIEGFGLPLVEAMQQSLPVIASDIPVFREIGGDYPRYFATGDVSDLMRVLKASPDAGRGAGHPAPVGWRSWDEAVAELVPTCLEIAATAGHTRPRPGAQDDG